MSMRAKFQILTVKKEEGYVNLHLNAVTEKPFDIEGKSDDNDFARWTPSASCEMMITNPALFDSFKEGQKFYVDFTEAKD